MRNMKATIVSFVLLCCLHLSMQQCRQLTVCDDESTRGEGQKGDVGAPGKAGPSGSKGARGEQGEVGEKGIQGESCSLGNFETEIRNKLSRIEDRSNPASCMTSSVNGRQFLSSGEEAVCDRGWTVFQKRQDGIVDFHLSWLEYQSGFGNLSGEFWLGLEKIHQLTKFQGCKLRVDLWGFDDDHAFAEYSSFSVEAESDNYRLHVGGYSGTAGDSLTFMITDHVHDNMQFTTRDRDNDNRGNGNCAAVSGGHGGWWFNNCFRSALNAPWGRSEGSWRNIIWYAWKGHSESLKATTMKLRCD